MRELNVEEKQKWLIDRQGKPFILFSGLVHLAHEAGLVGTSTEVVQLPSGSNEGSAVLLCTATFEKDGLQRTFRCIGDASAANVGRAIALHIIRMAETRGLGRCFRVALDVGYTAYEELEGEEDAQEPRRNASSNKTAPALSVVPPNPDVPGSCQPATKEQLDRLVKLQAALGRPKQAPEGLSFDEAAAQIKEMVAIFNQQAKGGKK